MPSSTRCATFCDGGSDHNSFAAKTQGSQSKFEKSFACFAFFAVRLFLVLALG